MSEPWTVRFLRLLPAYAIALTAILITLFPIVWIFTISIKTKRDAFAIPPIWRFEPVWQNYWSLWENDTFRNAILNTATITAIGVVLSIAIAIPAAYALNRLQVRGKALIAAWLLLAYMLPEFLFIIPMYVLYQAIGLYDTQIGLALVYQVHVLPFAIWMLRSFFAEIPTELDEAARIDGCGHWRTLMVVYVPMSLPGIGATAVLSAIWIWNELAIALGLTFSNAQPLTLAVASFRGYASIDWGPMSAASIVAIIPMLLFALIAQKWIVKGLTLGAVKG
ncbi:MAG: carbohydrate ABC transporter permease [Nitrospirota bacterium]|nr:carbohydrate ABC transporter permease [Nitrospirota bacterium]